MNLLSEFVAAWLTLNSEIFAMPDLHGFPTWGPAVAALLYLFAAGHDYNRGIEPEKELKIAWKWLLLAILWLIASVSTDGVSMVFIAILAEIYVALRVLSIIVLFFFRSIKGILGIQDIKVDTEKSD